MNNLRNLPTSPLTSPFKTFCKLSKPLLVLILMMLVLPFLYSIVLPNFGLDTSFVTKKRSITVIDSITKKAIPNCSVLVVWHSPYTNFPDHSSSITTSNITLKTDLNGVVTIDSKIKYPAFNLMPLLFIEKTNVIAVAYADGYRLRNIIPDEYEENSIEMEKITNRKQLLTEAHNIQTYLELLNNDLTTKSYISLNQYFNTLIKKSNVDITKPYWLED